MSQTPLAGYENQPKWDTPDRIAKSARLPLALLAGLLPGGSLHAQIFVTENGNDTLGEYNFDGSTVSASLFTGLNGPYGIALEGEPGGFGPGTGGCGGPGSAQVRRKMRREKP